jgi:hypothetical protein
VTLASFFSWLETTDVARAIAESLLATASLSALHVIGFTSTLFAKSYARWCTERMTSDAVKYLSSGDRSP